MKKKIMLTTTVLALTAGSIFALSAGSTEKAAVKAATEQCPPECCNGNGGNCGPDDSCS